MKDFISHNDSSEIFLYFYNSEKEDVKHGNLESVSSLFMRVYEWRARLDARKLQVQGPHLTVDCLTTLIWLLH